MFKEFRIMLLRVAEKAVPGKARAAAAGGMIKKMIDVLASIMLWKYSDPRHEIRSRRLSMVG